MLGGVVMFSSFHDLKGRAIYLFICGAFFFCWVVFLRCSGPRPVKLKVKVVPVETYRRAVEITVVDFDSGAYYCPILDYNLFRPLDWRPPRPREPDRLIGTILPRSANRPPQAVVQRTTSHQGNNRHENNNPILDICV